MQKLYEHGLKPLLGYLKKPAVRLVINLLVFGFCIAYLLTHFQDILVEIKEVQFAGWKLSFALLLIWAVDWMGAVSWWLLLMGFGQKVDLLESWRVHLKSAIAKYVPGFVWQYLGKGYLTRQMGVPIKFSGILIVWEVFQLLWIGTGVGFLFLPNLEIIDWKLSGWMQFAIPFTGGMMLLAQFIFPFVAPKLQNWPLFSEIAFQGKYLFFSAITVFSGWMLQGIGLWLTTAAFVPVRLDIPFFVFGFSISLVAGILAIPVPYGLGIREGILVYHLGHVIPEPLALLVATVSRFALITGEFICLVIVEVIFRFKFRKGLGIALKKKEYF